MSAFSLALTLAGNGDVLALALPDGSLSGPRVRFRGKRGISHYDETVVQSRYPSTTLNAHEFTTYDIPVPADYSFIRSSSSNPAITLSRTRSGDTDTWRFTNTSGSMQSSNISIEYVDSVPAYADSQNPQVTIAGHVSRYTGTLADGVYSPWVTCTGLSAGVTNSITVGVSGSPQVYVEVEATISALAVTGIEPSAFAQMTHDALVFQLSAAALGGATPPAWFPRIRVNQYDAWGSPTYDWDSTISRAGWTYESGGSWVALPPEGAPLGAQVRFTPPVELAAFSWCWKASGWESVTGWSAESDTKRFRILLAIWSATALEIGGVDFTGKASAFRISLATCGEVSFIEFRLSAATAPEAETDVVLAVQDEDGGSIQIVGRVWGKAKPAGQGLFAVRVKLGDSILEERVVRQDYVSQDLGLTLKQAVDTYGAPLVSTGIDVATGISRPVPATGMTLGDLAREICPEAGLFFWTDSTVDPPAEHAVKPANLLPAMILFRRGQSS